MGRVGLTQTIFGWGTQPSQVLWVGYTEKCWVPGVTRGFAHVIEKRDFINQIRTRYTEISGASGISPTSGLKCPSYTEYHTMAISMKIYCLSIPENI